MAYRSLVEAFAQPGYNPASDKALQEQIARELGLLSQFNYTDLSGNSETRFGIDPANQAQVLAEIQRRHSESLVPAELRQAYAPVNYGIGTDSLRDAQGRVLGKYMLGENGRELDGTVKDDSSVHYAPWDILQQYPQLGGELATQFQQAKDPIGDFLGVAVPLGVAGIMGGGALGMLPGAGGAAAAAPFAEMAAAETALASGAGGVAAGGTAAAAGSLMPAAQAVAPAQLAEWGLVEVAPGVFSSAGAAGAGAAAGGLMPPAQPMSQAQLSQMGLTEVSPGVYASGGAAGGTAAAGMPSAVSNGASTLFGQLKDIGKEVAPYAPLLGAAAGGLLGGTSGTGSAGSITVEDGIPDWLMQYMKPTLDQYSTQIQNYQTDPYGLMPAAAQQFKNTIDGQFLDPATNKYLEQYFNLGAERVKGTLSPSFGHMQAFGSHSGYNEALSRGLGDLATGLYGGAYERERDRQSQAITAAPQFLTQQSTAAFAPFQQYLSTVGSLGKKKEQPFFEPSNFQNILGGAMAGYGLGGIFG